MVRTEVFCCCCGFILFLFLIYLFIYCTLDSGVHVQIMQDCCIGTYMKMWFAPSTPHHLYLAFLPMLSLPYLQTTHWPSLSPPNKPQCVMLPSMCPCVLIVQQPPMSEKLWFGFLFLCQFAENDSFQIHSCPYKGHELIVFYGCIVLNDVYASHFSCPVYHWWAFGCHNEHTCACVFIIEQFIILWVYTQWWDFWVK